MNLFNRRTFLFLFLPCFLLAACGQFGPDDGRPHKNKGVADKEVLSRPDLFTRAPDKIEGCAGLYTYDSLKIPFDNLDIDKGAKIFATELSTFAYFRVQGHEVYLKYDSGQSKQVDEKTHKEVFRGSGYTAVLVVRSLRTEGEAVWEEGTLEISKGNKSIKIKVRGLSGC